ncbi:DUF6879 family protein [Streptomyces sp. NPDC014623]|uniref:DUF6879 family protein n=1 Tax=Streptomyces sp. NPDC014623 TaxID=3364875 RepID=UPI0036FEBE16
MLKARRVRIVSESVTGCIRFEHAITEASLRVGEQIRRLSCHRASPLALPANDFWLIGDRIVRWDIFSGDGEALEPDHTEDPQAVKLCVEAFRSVGPGSRSHRHAREPPARTRGHRSRQARAFTTSPLSSPP